jgi:hypothetical protein
MLLGVALVALCTTGCLSPVEEWTGKEDPSAFPRETATGVTVTAVDCETHGTRLTPTTMEEERQRLLGIWVRCTSPLPGWAQASPLGAEFLEIRDRSWHRLELQPDGTLLRRVDLGGSGAVRFVDVSAMNGDRVVLQADFEGVDGGWYLTQPRFEAAPDRVRLTVYPDDAFDFARLR